MQVLERAVFQGNYLGCLGLTSHLSLACHTLGWRYLLDKNGELVIRTGFCEGLERSWKEGWADLPGLRKGESLVSLCRGWRQVYEQRVKHGPVWKSERKEKRVCRILGKMYFFVFPDKEVFGRASWCTECLSRFLNFCN